MRELDAKVAEKVMGWKRSQFNANHFEISPSSYRSIVPESWHGFEPSTNAVDDYEVLKHVRENWEQLMHDKFTECLGKIWVKRREDKTKFVNFAMCYEPGDYSRAALKALGEEVG